ncbi:hypothetical protein [Ancylobacter mangrovi]|uniref:Uncharacterized protein n=1 Tax=Ancylobacter mangrovi TaxID=2972472 RepID=A0A9X2PAR2_9HYPH|nr:hypothetical protein [Ancylobacter mangrovi]MCS0495342.1 hypothetical protein [Ancylobacter mangrovi]MCS0502988.1 hypothetical protein [Ancylobacter mangrovi]
MNSTDPFDRMRFTVRRVSWWQVALVVAVAVAVGIALALVAASVFLVVFPILALAGLAYRLFGGRKSRGRASGSTVIDAEYRVLSPEEAAREEGSPWNSNWGPDRRLR